MVKLIPCEIYTRVVGFYRPVSQFNMGKKQEFKERTTYKLLEATSENRVFIESGGVTKV